MLKNVSNYIEDGILRQLRKQLSDLNRLLIGLSSSALVLSFTVVSFLGNQEYFQIQAVLFLIISWFFLGISIISGVIFEISLINFQAKWIGGVINNAIKGVNEQNPIEKEKFLKKSDKEAKACWDSFNKWGMNFDYIQQYGFFIAMASLTIFIIANFWQYSDFLNITINNFLLNLWKFFF